MNDPNASRARQAAEYELEVSLFSRNLFVLTVLGAVAFIAGTAFVMLH